jgi:hypothetical protein
MGILSNLDCERIFVSGESFDGHGFKHCSTVIWCSLIERRNLLTDDNNTTFNGYGFKRVFVFRGNVALLPYRVI